MRPNAVISSRWVWLLWLGLSVVLFSGCATSDPENASARPWNQPRVWETGLPPPMYEGR